ncbi:DNA topoisomerase (ATP-hydrolyzing) subunit A [Kytococcus sp. HMSC28H12]|uniref:DNA gyrase/topoisomerase IV subunit A n=1 Tax=Kytococcus sp. HMSC28H12 TaxID=1581067 RepID=UPI0008A56552|nr:DNA topoisomerase IV [Kytococcus sp. HMSC28H12]
MWPVPKKSDKPAEPTQVADTVIDIDVAEEMSSAFLEYAYSVIYSRALPDARDGLKPVQRRILFGMDELVLRPDRGYVKSSRVVGEVMGKYHPHGDQAIYDALVRLAQPFTMRLPLVDGHGNFGSLDDGPAASRYTEARMAPAALTMTATLDEDTVDMVPNYDDQLLQPEVLPAAYPNLLVNGASGIAVGMATNIAPHNLREVVAAARHLLDNPAATVEDLMRFVPGPDLPGGGRIVGLDGIRDAYRTGRGSFRTRAKATIENVTPRRKGIVVTELPYLVGPEKVIAKLKTQVQAKKLQGIADVKDLTDRHNGLQLVIEVKNGFNPEAVLAQLYKQTPMEESFGINTVALVDGQPRTLGLKEALQVYVDFRCEVVRRRTAFRLGKRRDRLHLVEGLLLAILDIDEVIQLVRSSDDAAEARTRLMEVFDLSEAQASYILELQLRRLTKFSRIELETERDELQAAIAELEAILADEARLRGVVSDELAAVAAEHGTPRRTVLLESEAAAAMVPAAPLEVADDPVTVALSATGLIARVPREEDTSGALVRTDVRPADAPRVDHDAIASVVAATARGQVGLVTSAGRLVRLSVVDLPALPAAGSLGLTGGAPVAAFVDLAGGERPLALVRTDDVEGTAGLALGTARGVVKRVRPEYPASKDAMEVISLAEGDELVGAAELSDGSEELVFVTDAAALLRYPASLVRPQGLSGGGVAGIKVPEGGRVVAFAPVRTGGEGETDAPAPVVVTVAGSAGALPGSGGSVKVTPLEAYPGKGRATAGVRCHRFLKGEDALVLAWVGADPRAVDAGGSAVALPEPTDRRDGSGTPAPAAILGIG